MRLILASNSPRRKEFLKKYRFEFDVISSTYEEISFTTDPYELTKAFAYGKAKSVFDSLPNKDDVAVLGADTVVYFEGEILGKPKDEKDAKNMLKNLSGKTHQVISAYALITARNCTVETDLSEVVFNDLSDQLIDDYVATKSPLDKAGGYGIQDGFNLARKIVGSYDNVVGLPTEKVIPLLKNVIK